MADILIVDDDPNLREVVRYALSREGFEVREASDGVAALRAFRASEPDLVVLDVLMPELDGLEVCRRIRETSKTPIVFLSTRGEAMDRILGLDLGGDDYLPKPFSTRELVSRVNAILRRTRDDSRAPLEVGSIRLDPAEHRVTVSGHALVLTLTEFRILAVLMSRPGRAYSRDDLIDCAYPGPHHVSGRTLDSHVRRIRAKLREAGVDPIETVHGLGYRLQRP